MPLYNNAKSLIRANLEKISQGGREKVQAVDIGQFTPAQHAAINRIKKSAGLPQLESPVIVFIGSHLYKSRVVKDGYTLADVLLQIEYAVAETAIVVNSHTMTATRSATSRQDGYGNTVEDQAVFELTQRKPKAELFSVMPKGDRVKPPKPQG